MADTDNSVKPTSPYDYPRSQLFDPKLTSEESVEHKKDEGTSGNQDTEIEINEDRNNEEKIKEKENELPETEENDDDDENGKRDTEKPLLDEKDPVKIEITPDNEGDDTPTLPLPDKKRKSIEALELEDKQERKLPKYLFPLTRIKNAWDDSSNVFQFTGTAVCIIFQTVGWFTCVGGIPFLSLVMLIIGSIYVYECKVQPNIPIYLIISGLMGTIQHFLAIWINYVPRDSQGRLKVYRAYFRSLNGLLHIFLLIWFIIGSIWVYSVYSEVDFVDPEKEEYCNQTLYYFSFWVFNLSFILIGLLIFLSVCFLICALAASDN